MDEVLVTDVEGTNGKASLFEVTKPQPNGVMAIEYEVRCGERVERFPSLGEAYIVAQELAGTETRR